MSRLSIGVQPFRLPRIWESVKRTVEPHLHLFAFLTAVALCGLVFGAIVAGQLNQADSAVLSQTVDRLLTAVAHRDLAPPGQLWWHRMIGDGQLLALIWLFGVSVIGLPFVVIAVFLRAFSVGFAVGFTVLHFGWHGLVVASIGIFLHQAVSLTAVVCAGVVAIRFSAGILRQAVPLSKMTVSFLSYTGWFLVFALALAAGAFIQASVAPPLLHSALAP
jgi:stage II sporulation protein M